MGISEVPGIQMEQGSSPRSVSPSGESGKQRNFPIFPLLISFPGLPFLLSQPCPTVPKQHTPPHTSTFFSFCASFQAVWVAKKCSVCKANRAVAYQQSLITQLMGFYSLEEPVPDWENPARRPPHYGDVPPLASLCTWALGKP